jgi:hypothetical protein
MIVLKELKKMEVNHTLKSICFTSLPFGLQEAIEQFLLYNSPLFDGANEYVPIVSKKVLSQGDVIDLVEYKCNAQHDGWTLEFILKDWLEDYTNIQKNNGLIVLEVAD